MLLSPDELTVIKENKVLYYSTKMGGCAPYEKKGGDLKLPSPPIPPPMNNNNKVYLIAESLSLKSGLSSKEPCPLTLILKLTLKNYGHKVKNLV